MTQTTTRPPAAGLRSAVAASTTPPPAGSPRPQIGAWTLLRLVRETQLARVYRVCPAVGPSTGDYALKLLRPDRQASPEAVRCWRREAAAGGQVSHPRLLPVLAAHVAAPPYYLVTPWLEGATVAERLAAGWRPGVAAALWIARQTAEALAALHAAGWMHGDVKPDNVHLSPRGRATLLDLGFARRDGRLAPPLLETQQTDATLDRLLLGTAAYLAPEAAASAAGSDIRADLYSLGVMLFELLAGRLPFDDADAGQLLRRHCAERPPRLRRIAPGVPREVDEFVRGLLAKQPLRRPQTPQDVVRTLTSLEVSAFADRV